MAGFIDDLVSERGIASREELARLAEVEGSTLHRINKGKNFKIDQARKVARGLGMQVGDFIARHEQFFPDLVA